MSSGTVRRSVGEGVNDAVGVGVEYPEVGVRARAGFAERFAEQLDADSYSAFSANGISLIDVIEDVAAAVQG